MKAIDWWNRIQMAIIVILIILFIGAIYWAYQWVNTKLKDLGLDFFNKNAECKKKFGEKSFWDIGKKKCYSCPEGTKRSVTPVTAKDACVSQCPEGTFEHWISGDCWKCPDGSERSFNPDIKADDACVTSKINPCKKKNPNWFQHGLSGQCYSCPPNTKRTLAGIDAENACKGTCPKGSFEHMFSGQCYTCGDRDRTVYDIKGDKACLHTWKSCKDLNGKDAFEHMLSGKCYKCPPGMRRSLQALKGKRACVSTKTCKQLNGENSFLDIISGECHDCPKNYNRSLLNLDIKGKRACVSTKTCKQLNDNKDAFGDLLSGKCYSCPDGSNRTVFGVKSNKACLNPKTCKNLNKNHEKSSSMFNDFLRGTCHYCPDGTRRTAAPIDSPNACRSTKNCNAMFPGSFEHWFGGDCFKCPVVDGEQSKRSIFGINGDRACRINVYSPNDKIRWIPKNIKYFKAVKAGSLNKKAIGSESDKTIKDRMNKATLLKNHLFTSANPSIKSRFSSILDDKIIDRFGKAEPTANIHFKATPQARRIKAAEPTANIHFKARKEESITSKAKFVKNIHFKANLDGTLEDFGDRSDIFANNLGKIGI